MATSRNKILIWVALLATVMACVVPGVGAPAVPTIDAQAVNTFIVQTANAAATQTVKAMPTASPTATFTPTPRNTDTPTPTPTNTVVFLLKSPTPIVPTAIPGISGGGNVGGYACELLSVSPANGTTFKPRTNFNAVWTVKNTGKKTWDRNSVDFIYASGDKIHKVSGYDLTKNVDPGQSISFTVSMQAPKNPSPYTTFWTLRVGSGTFCRVALYILVQ